MLKTGGLSAMTAVIAISSLLLCKTGHGAEAMVSVEKQFGQASEGFQISLVFLKDQFNAEEPITAVVMTRNVSDRDLTFVGSVPHYVEFIVVDEIGGRVPPRDEIQPNDNGLRRTMVNNPKYIDLASNEEHVDRIDLRKVFDLPQGKYAVSVSRTVPVITDWRIKSQVMSGNATFFSAGFKPQEGGTRTAQQSNGINKKLVPAKANPAASLTNVVSNQPQIATNGATAELLPPEQSRNVDVTTSFAQTQGQSTKLFWILGIAALIVMVLVVRFVRRKKSAG